MGKVYIYTKRGEKHEQNHPAHRRPHPCLRKARGLTPQEPTEELKNQLLFTNKELRRWQKLNMLVVDNRG